MYHYDLLTSAEGYSLYSQTKLITQEQPPRELCFRNCDDLPSNVTTGVCSTVE